MERVPDNKREIISTELLQAAHVWAEGKSQEILQAGEALREDEFALAKEVGVLQPEQVKILEVDEIPSLEDEVLIEIADQAGLSFSRSKGMTLGYGIYIVKGYRSARLVSHELRHVFQYEEAGSLQEFLKRYIAELQTYGYQDAPLEIDAKNHEIS